ncbi:hypothetical protein PVAND_008251 [Polypedilum vanderplanki]|uniref:FERM domain-containing protein n=1 Tax=Polypedilum vanderplanki TaxID=319348 RepID=A0A9J6C9J5_POLVA|nr:hypothetical protein PVAND_008251 [Polypedilum vanderplanki]
MYCFCRSSKTISVRIIFLDETDFLHDIQKELLGQSLLEVVFNRLNLLETAYFGLRYLDFEGQTHWLDANSRLSRQLKENKDIYELYFSVKFYAVDPCKLVEEITRYHFYLQLRQDVLQGRLPVLFDLASQLGAYVIQSELGDFDSSKHTYGYVSEFRIVPNQTKEIEYRVAELHKQLKGVSSAQAEFNYLDKVKWLDMYGVDLHPVLGEDSVEYFLGLTPSGIIVLRNKTTVAHYYWPRIAKVYFKGRYFMLRVCDKNNEVNTYGFETPKKAACKHLWKCCVEHHAFFRLVRVSPTHAGGDFFSLGSRFRYSGTKTEQKASKDASNISRPPPFFTRKPSRRQIRRNFDSNHHEQTFETENKRKFETKSISVPQPAYTYDNVYRSTCSIPATLNNNNTINSKYSQHSAPDSPRSTKSAGWIRSQQRGLFGINSSPKSVRSASSRNGNSNSNGHRHRSSSVESQSSNDSRSGRRHRSRSKRMSDNESELSRGSGRSGRSHRKHRRHRSRNRESGSERGGNRDHNHNDKYSESLELVDSNTQWLEVQRKQAEKSNLGTVQQAVIKSNTAPKSNNSTDTYSRNKKNRKHRSPTDSRNNKIWSSELSRHLQFDLVDTEGMTEEQLREIPYTVVETQNTQNRKRNSTNSLKVHKNTYAKDRVDRIRIGPQMSSDKNMMDGSIRSGSTNSSSQDFERNNNGLNRMISSLSIGEFANSSNLNRIDYAGIRVSHEHTDSGLGDQDYAYSSERSSDSAKYTNKSSGTSVLSGNINSFHTKFYNKGTRHHENERQSHNKSTLITSAAPVHKKFVPKSGHCDSFINRFINNNNAQCSNGHNNNHNNNKHYSLSLKRHTPNHVNINNIGVGCIGTLTSPYAFSYGSGKNGNRGGSKSDVGVPISSKRGTATRSLQKNNLYNYHGKLGQQLPSVHSDLSIYDATFRESYNNLSDVQKDMLNNNSDNGNHITSSASTTTTAAAAESTITSSAIMSLSSLSKTGSKLLYSNRHRLDSSKNANNNINNNNPSTFNDMNVVCHQGPLIYKNEDELIRCDWNNSVFDNPIMSSSDGLSSVEKLNNNAVNSSSTNDHRNNLPNSSKSSSLELILTPIIQSRRSKH